MTLQHVGHNLLNLPGLKFLDLHQPSQSLWKFYCLFETCSPHLFLVSALSSLVLRRLFKLSCVETLALFLLVLFMLPSPLCLTRLDTCSECRYGLRELASEGSNLRSEEKPELSSTEAGR